MSELVVELNGLAINDGNTGFYLDGEVSGLGFADIRTTSGLISGDNGGYVSKQLFGMRPISLTGRAFATDVATTFTKRQQLQAALAPLAVTMKVRTYDGKSWLIYANLTNFDMPLKDSLNFADFKIDLLAPDPVIYDDTNGTGLSVPISRIIAGGFTWPIVWPLVWSASTSPSTVVNNGNVFVKPLITLTGVMTNPVLTNITTGQVLSLTGLTTSPGDVVVIDMKNRTVTLNGGNILDKVASPRQWWGLAVGSNDVKLETGSGSDNVTGTVSWRSGVSGI